MTAMPKIRAAFALTGSKKTGWATSFARQEESDEYYR
jgi:hypothetical protein